MQTLCMYCMYALYVCMYVCMYAITRVRYPSPSKSYRMESCSSLTATAIQTLRRSSTPSQQVRLGQGVCGQPVLLSDTYIHKCCCLPTIAIGRAPDLPGLGFGAASGLEPVISEKSGKLVCKNEQTSIPHIYAIGDVIHLGPPIHNRCPIVYIQQQYPF